MTAPSEDMRIKYISSEYTNAVNYECRSQNKMEQSTSEQIQDQQFDFGYSDSETESDPGPDDFHRYYKLYKPVFILHTTFVYTCLNLIVCLLSLYCWGVKILNFVVAVPS